MLTKARADQRKHHIIYKTTCLITGRWYLGLHSTDDLDDGYRGSGIHLQYSLKKYGKENHTYEILELLPSRKELVQREVELITEEMVKDPMCMNLMKGGGREVHSDILKEEARAKISAVAKEMWSRRKADPIAYNQHVAKLNTPDKIAKRASAIKAKGHKRSPEQLARLAAGQSKYYLEASKDILKERGQKSAATRFVRGTNKGGRPPGTPATESQKICKNWLIQKECGESFVIRNLTQFCRDQDLKRTSFGRTLELDRFMNGFKLLGPANANT